MGKNIVRAAGLLLVINIFVKLLGFAREMAIAHGFGASSASDAYIVAYTIPYFFQTILGYAFVSAVLPLLGAYWREDGDNEEAFRIGSTIINLVAVAMLALSALGVAIAPLLVRLTAPHLAADTAELAAGLTRIIFPSLAFMSAGMVVSGILNSRYRFAVAALAPGVVSLAIIVCAMFFSRGDIYVVAAGTLAGFIGFFLLQAADLPRSGFRYSLVFDIRHPAIRRLLKEIAPIMIGMSVSQIYTVANRIFASGLSEGSISALNYASKLMNLPLGLFVAAIITAVFPRLAELARDADRTRLAATVSQGLSMSMLIAVPAALGLMLLDQEIIRLLFESGSFTAADTLVTAQALFGMCPGLVFMAATMLLMRVCYAMGDIKTPLLTGGVSVAVNILASLLLVGPLEHAGLAWANSAAMAVNALLLAGALQKRLGFLSFGLWRNLAVTILSSGVMGAAVAAFPALWPSAPGKMTLALAVAAAMAAGMVIYFIMLRLLKCQALQALTRGLAKTKADN